VYISTLHVRPPSPRNQEKQRSYIQYTYHIYSSPTTAPGTSLPAPTSNHHAVPPCPSDNGSPDPNATLNVNWRSTCTAIRLQHRKATSESRPSNPATMATEAATATRRPPRRSRRWRLRVPCGLCPLFLVPLASEQLSALWRRPSNAGCSQRLLAVFSSRQSCESAQMPTTAKPPLRPTQLSSAQLSFAVEEMQVTPSVSVVCHASGAMPPRMQGTDQSPPQQQHRHHSHRLRLPA